MAKNHATLEDLREKVDKIWFNSVDVRMLAVLAELEEKAKPKREATQAEIAQRYGASERMLRYWVSWYTKHGVEGLVDLGGRGAKPRHSREKMGAIINACMEETGEPPADGGGGRGGKPRKLSEPCRPCELAKEGKRPGPRPAPGPCPCKGRCVTRGRRGRGCACERGKACACRCCRPIRLRPKGPRHAPDCPNRRISPANGTSVARVRAAMKKELGDSYSPRHIRRIMSELSLSHRRITRRHANHAPSPEVKRWQGRLRPSLKKYEKDDWMVFLHDEGHVVHDKDDGDSWGPRGERTTLPRSGSGQRVTLHASISTKKDVVAGEYARGDSFTFADHVEELVKKYDKVLVITDNHSSHTSKDFKRLLRRIRRKYPGKKVRIRTLPVGSPHLNVVEEFWNMLKAALLSRYHYKESDDMRWEIHDFMENNKTIDLDALEYLFRNPEPYVVA